MNASRETFLVDSLKHVSLQRLRRLKMDMDRMAKDSRINNDRGAFWALLDSHNIRLDERTKQDFYHRVADHKGVDIEAAIKHLQKAQKDTGRDSVEVLKKPTESAVATETNRKVPNSTPMQITIPKLPMSASPRNYKLDKLREKIRGVGRLQIALKRLSAVKSNGNPENNSEPGRKTVEETNNASSKNETEISERATAAASGSFLKLILEDDNSKTKDARSVSDEKQGTTTEISKVSTDVESRTEKVSAKSTEQHGNNSSITDHIHEKACGKSEFEDVTVGNSDEKNLEIPHDSKEENKIENPTQESITSSQGSIDSENGANEKDSQPVAKFGATNEKDKTELKETGQNANVYDEKEPSISTMNGSADMQECSDKSNRNINETFRLPFVSSEEDVKMKSSNSSEASDNQEDLVEPQHQCEQDDPTISSCNTNVFLSHQDDKEKTSEMEQLAEEAKTNAEESVIFAQTQGQSENELTQDSSLGKGSDNEPITDETQMEEKESDKAETCIRNSSTKTEQNQPTENDAYNLEESSRPENEESDGIHPKTPTTNKETIPKEKSNFEKFSAVEKSPIKNRTEVPASDTNTETHLVEKDPTMSKKHNSTEQKHKPNKNAKTTNKQKIAEKEKNETNAKSEKLGKNENYKKSSEKNQTEPNDSAETKKKSLTTKNEVASDIWSISTESSTDDEVSSLDAVLKDISSLHKEATAKVMIGETKIELSVPSWLNDQKRRQDIDQLPALEVDYMYGCDTTHSQCMVSTKQGELVYFAGSVAAVYDHIRMTQRCYLEHSAPITSIVIHHFDDLVASAQFNNTTNISSNASKHSDSQHGLPHVRVWNYLRMETVQVIGLGILRHPVYKMAFVNFKDYFVTIEEDEESTMTVWEGGCKVTNKSSSFIESVTEKVKEEAKPVKKRFVSTRARSNYHPQQAKFTKLTIQEQKPHAPVNFQNGPRSISGNLSEAGWYVTVGKHHLSFWELQENEDQNDEGYHISNPEYGDFGKSFFRAEYITTCLATNNYLDGCVITGDSNGTLLMWSQRTKIAMRGFSHAHECAIAAICLSDEGYIFTAGSKDRLVKAFQMPKTKFEACGKLMIPQGMGCAVCLTCNEKTLFVGTEKSVILSVDLITKTNSDVYSSLPDKPSIPYYLSGRSASTGVLLSKNSSNDVTPRSLSEEPNVKITSIFSIWNDFEVARGFVKGLITTCSMKPLKLKKRGRKDENHDLLSLPTSDECVALLHRQMVKSAGAARQKLKFSKALRPKEAIYAWRSLESGSSKIIRKPAPSAFSPRLRTNERMLYKEKVIEASRLKALPSFAATNHVKTSDIFSPNLNEASTRRDLFAAATKDGWILIYDAMSHRICGRCKVETNGDVTSLDVCSRRHFVVIGETIGHVTLTRINPDHFEVFPSVKCVCSGRGPSKINALKFSPSGRQLAVSIGYDVIIFFLRQTKLTERGRCVGHTSDHISSLSWTTKKYYETHFLRTCSVYPVAELKLWRTDNFTEVSEKNISHRLHWDSSPLVDYCSKGIWTQFSNPDDIKSLRFCKIISPKQKETFDDRSVAKSKSENIKRDENSNSYLLVGDSSGNLHLRPFPCLEWNPDQSTFYRAHCTQIKSITMSSSEKLIFSTSSTDASIVQWIFCKDEFGR